MLRKLSRILLAFLLTALIAACAPGKEATEFSPKQTYSLQRATQLAAQHILDSVDQQRGSLARFVSMQVMVDSIQGVNTAQNQSIQNLLQAQLEQKAASYHRMKIVSERPARSLRRSYHYRVSGAVKPFRGQYDRYQWVLEVRHISTGRLITTTKYLLQGHRPAAKPEQLASVSTKPVSLSQAVTAVADHVFSRVRKQQTQVLQGSNTVISMTPVLDGYSRERLQISRQIRQQLQQLARKQGGLQLVPLSSHSLKQSQYVMDVFLSPDKQQKNSYTLDVVARYLGSAKVVARASAKVKGSQFSQVTAEYQDSPIYAYTRNSGSITSVSVGKSYHETLKGRALLTEAGEAYAKRQYAIALQRYTQGLQHVRAEERLRAYAGLYMTHLRLGQQTQAEKALNQLLKLGFQGANGKLTFKILFQVNSTAFYGNPFVVRQYALWTKKIAQFTVTDKRCMTIVGHSSRTGAMSYNIALSERRARHIRDVMVGDVSGSAAYLATSGKGFSENLIGTGTDDARDALDRRVEFSLRGC